MNIVHIRAIKKPVTGREKSADPVNKTWDLEMRITSAVKTAAILSLGILAICAPKTAVAQDQDTQSQDTSVQPTQISDQIITTARRRNETLFEVPASASVVSADTLERARLDEIDSIMLLIPNAVVPDNPQSFNTFINIRGVRQPDPQTEAAVGLYRNGVFFGGHRPNLGSLVDLARVEVLRGPQGGLFGRNAVGGAINIVYATPVDEYEGYASFTYGRFQRTDGEAMINIPITDTFAIRGVGWIFNQEKGEFFNETLNEQIDKSQDLGGRLSARADLAENFVVTVIGEYQKTKTPSNRTFSPDGAVQPFGFRGAPETPKTIQNDTPNRGRFEQYYLSADAELDTSIGTFTLLGAYRDYKYNSIEDQDFTAIPADTPPTIPGTFPIVQSFTRAENVDSHFIELLWTSPQDQKLSWITGISYFGEDFDFSRTFTSVLNLDFLGFAPLGVRDASAALPGPSKIDTKSISAFAEFTYQATEKLSLIASLRWTQDKKRLTYSQFIFSDDPVSLPIFQFLFAGTVPTFQLDSRQKFDNWSPGGGIQYEANENMSLYATVNTGFRAGSFNTTSTNPDLIPYGQEDAINYEIGIKTRWLDGKLDVNVSAFLMRQSDLLLFRDDPVDDIFFFTFLDNVGKGRTWGAELEVVAQVAEWLTASASIGWLDARISDGENQEASGNFIDVSGNKIPVTRDFTFSMQLDFQQPISNSDWRMIGYVNARIETGGFIDINNTEKYRGLELLDLAAGVENDNFRILAYVDNVFNDRITTFRFSVGAETLTTGRRYGVELSARF